MTSSTFNPWPFQVSASAEGTLSGNVASLKAPSVDISAILWLEMTRIAAQSAAAIRANAPEALV